MSIVGAMVEAVAEKAEDSLARVKFGRRLSRDGVVRFRVRAMSSEDERVWIGEDEENERESSRGGLGRKRSRSLLAMVRECGLPGAPGRQSGKHATGT